MVTITAGVTPLPGTALYARVPGSGVTLGVIVTTPCASVVHEPHPQYLRTRMLMGALCLV